jgi:Na+-transporting NADH:ubiquinone oxidoreductase subunit A
MKTLALKKGYHLRLAGRPGDGLRELLRPARVAVEPERLRLSRPRPRVKVGDRVKAGGLLFADQTRPEMPLRSPGGGRVAAVEFGPRRRLKRIVVALDPEEAFEEFPPLDPGEIERIPLAALRERVLASGLWPLVRELPFRCPARPELKPAAVFVHLDNFEPFHPRPEIYLEGAHERFECGLRVLERLAEAPVRVTAGAESLAALNGMPVSVTHAVSGRYPAHDPGVLLFRTKRSAEENRAWFLGGQAVLLLAEHLLTGRYPTRQVVAVGGPAAREPLHVLARIGHPVAELAAGQGADAGVERLAGGIFTGHAVAADAFLNLDETALLLLPEIRPAELPFAWALPGSRTPSYSRAFLSAFLPPRERALDLDRHGGLRACIQCGFCPRVCPVDILPQLAYKALHAGEIEEALAHGLLDCVECGLCSFVCPSKIELAETFRAARRRYLDEMR